MTSPADGESAGCAGTEAPGTNIANPNRVPTLARGVTAFAPPVVMQRSPSKFPAEAPMLSLLRGWNVAGPDGALSPLWTPVGLVSSVEATGRVAPSRFKVTETTDAYGRITAPLDSRVNLVKGGIAHLLMLVKADAPANGFAWTIGGLTARRQSINELHSARDYQTGALRWVHSVARYESGDSFGASPTLTIWFNYNGIKSDLNVEIEGVWLFAAPFTDQRPEFDFTAPLLSAGAPSQGAWARGQRVEHGAPSASGSAGWVCTASGTPGTWKSYSAISA
ncbi:MAG: hypothetical protein J0I43_03755 [Microbacterium sp.]|uniref:hypothetical protein n=1 Tax=Microbacterium sp. TaxID=51671 RepID=UPI001ACAD31C|nr:hypothetical protein [Microbacterium sp.]MBN9176467.1 hypothetical protein [Microbacterium sp.]